MTARLLTALGAAALRGLAGGPTPVAPPAGAPATPVVDGVVTATQVAGGAVDLSAIALAVIVAAALVGVARGARREFVTWLVTLVWALVVGRLWPVLAWVVTRSWNVAAALVPGGILRPTALPTENAASWQIGFFLVGVVVLAYGGSRLLAGGIAPARGALGVSSVLERLIGGGIGALTGMAVARFVLARTLPGAVVSPFSTGSRLAARVEALGPRAALGIMLLVLVLGALSIGSIDRGPRQKVYN